MEEKTKPNKILYWIFLAIIILVAIDLISGYVLFKNTSAGIIAFIISTILKLFIPQENLTVVLGTIMSFSRILFVIAIPVIVFEKKKIDSFKKKNGDNEAKV